MSLPVLIAQTESAIDNIYIIYESANSLHLYELLFPLLSLASVKKRPYTLHRWFTFITWIPIQYCPFYS